VSERHGFVRILSAESANCFLRNGGFIILPLERVRWTEHGKLAQLLIKSKQSFLDAHHRLHSCAALFVLAPGPGRSMERKELLLGVLGRGPPCRASLVSELSLALSLSPPANRATQDHGHSVCSGEDPMREERALAGGALASNARAVCSISVHRQRGRGRGSSILTAEI